MRACKLCSTLNDDAHRFCISCGSAFPQLDPASLPTTPRQERFGFEKSDIITKERSLGVDIGERLQSRFLPVMHITTGGMGRLLLVQELLSGRYVALKVMLEENLMDTSLVHQFIREAVITARLQHPHIIPVYELGFLEKEHLYYTMRYVDGSPFNEVMQQVDLGEKLRILRGAALAVDHAHSHGLWHRDLKPQNILVGQLGEAYVIDWGLVTVQHGREYKLNLPRIVVEKSTFTLPDRLLEETNEACTLANDLIMGTPAYMAPEQFYGDNYTMGIVSDVWAFGVMLFEALTGQHPLGNYRSLSFNELKTSIVEKPFPQPDDLTIGLPRSLNQLCLQMLIKAPGQRMQSLEGFVEGVTEYLKSQAQTIGGLGTFAGISHHPLLNQVTEKENSQLQARIGLLQNENMLLRVENERNKRKVQLLTELSQLGVLESRRKKELWRELAQI